MLKPPTSNIPCNNMDVAEFKQLVLGLINWPIRGRIIGFRLNSKITHFSENNYFYEVGTDYYLMAAEPE